MSITIRLVLLVILGHKCCSRHSREPSNGIPGSRTRNVDEHVDDILLSRVDKSGAQKMITELMELLKIGSFELLKWSSNYVDVVFSRDSLLNTKGSVPYDPDFLAPFHFLIGKGYRNIHEISDDDDNDPSVLNPNRQRTEHTVEINTTWLVANLWKRWKN
ncbi:Peptidyl-prolyl cis-trans isomerase [Trichinella pseudospiralis]